MDIEGGYHQDHLKFALPDYSRGVHKKLTISALPRVFEKNAKTMSSFMFGVQKKGKIWYETRTSIFAYFSRRAYTKYPQRTIGPTQGNGILRPSYYKKWLFCSCPCYAYICGHISSATSAISHSTGRAVMSGYARWAFWTSSYVSIANTDVLFPIMFFFSLSNMTSYTFRSDFTRKLLVVLV